MPSRSRRSSLAAGSAALPVAAIDRSGALVRSDGTVVRILGVTPVNPLVLDPAAIEQLGAGFARLVEELEPGRALQFYLESRGADGAIGAHVAVPSTARAHRRRARSADSLLVSLLEVEALAARLAALGLPARLLDGPDVAALFMRRFGHAPAGRHDGRPIEVLGELDSEDEAAARAAGDLRERLAVLAPHFAARHAEIGRDLEQIVYLASAPGATRFGWMAHLLESATPSVVTVHVHAPAADAGPAMSLYQSIRDPGPDASLARIADAADAAADRLATAAMAGVHRGEFRQRELWLSTLPIALDEAALAHECAAPTLGSALPLVATRCGSPEGVPMLLVTGEQAPTTARALLAQLADFGMRVATVGPDHVRVGAWAVGVPHVAPDRIDFLVAIHELLLGELTPTERGSLRLGIRRVLTRAGGEAASRDLVAELARSDRTHDLRERLARVLASAAGDLLDGPAERAVDDAETAAETCAALLIAAEHRIGELTRGPLGAALLIEDAGALAAFPAAARRLRTAAHAARRKGVLLIAAAGAT